MPSASTFAHVALNNLGPLTTTYTAPASCATGTARVNIAFLTTPHALFEYSPDCTGQPVGDCVPSGAAIDSLASAALTTPAANAVFYYSPGLVCPSNWATMGAVAKAADGKFSTSGAFSATTPIPTRFFDPPLNIIMNAMDPGETAVVCCPRFVASAPAFLFLAFFYSSLSLFIYTHTYIYIYITSYIYVSHRRRTLS